jgi:AAA domain, putative AbiEii toxin, Type IV TA system
MLYKNPNLRGSHSVSSGTSAIENYQRIFARCGADCYRCAACICGAKHPWPFFVQNMSDGTLRASGVLTALFQGNLDYASTLVGIEEPETVLHPSASGALREALARAAQNMQIIVTSHSPDLLNNASYSADSLLVVVSQEGETIILPVDQASRDAIGERLFSAGELLRLNQLAPDPVVLAEQRNRQAA